MLSERDLRQLQRLVGLGVFLERRRGERQDLAVVRPEHVHHLEPAVEVGHHRHRLGAPRDVGGLADMRDQRLVEGLRPDVVEGVDLQHRPLPSDPRVPARSRRARSRSGSSAALEGLGRRAARRSPRAPRAPAASGPRRRSGERGDRGAAGVEDRRGDADDPRRDLAPRDGVAVAADLAQRVGISLGVAPMPCPAKSRRFSAISGSSVRRGSQARIARLMAPRASGIGRPRG